MKRINFLLIVAMFSVSNLSALDQDTIVTGKEEKIKKGFSLGGVPVVAYDADIGFKYGALVNLYWYGDGSRYPMYDHSVYIEWSRTTKGNGINQITYDTDKLIPGIRSFFEASYLTEKALDFYGFNGYQSVYDMDYEASTDMHDNRNALYYRHARQLLRLKADFQGKITGNRFRWLAGVAYYGNKIDSVDVDKLNEGKTSGLLSYNSLYGNYVQYGLIPEDQANGGGHTILKAGLVYDTRDNEPNPFRGIWTEMQLHYAPSFLSNTSYSYTRLVFTHRQYFTLIPEWMSLAYRLSYQGKLTGEMPFYMLPYLFNTAPKLTSDGVGGSKTVRGIRRNRVAGDGFAYGNIELRGKILRTTVWNQNVYIALSGFLDAGMVTQKYKFDTTGLPGSLPANLPENIIDLDEEEVPHLGYGGGVHIAINQNFIITVDYGFAARKEDGDSGLYINLNFLF
ncbi:MAG: BamA/TamA family outer membrane protein [Bacteroidales bacterium]|nr:BamA/TamA family outer membrane protein [Bacteroidales bacterium]MBN2699535.1 BamA/TamA family outer membrane protein [Bacteroidales bacterium]